MNTIMPRKDIITRTEGSDHSHEGECSGEHNHEATDGHNESAEAHSDEIILPKAKAEAAGVKVGVIEPAPFQQVIKTSGPGAGCPRG